MKRILLILMLLNFHLLDAKEIKYSLIEFISIASSQNNINILVNENIPQDSFFFFIGNEKDVISFRVLKSMLNSKGLSLLQYDGYYFVDYMDSNNTVLDVLSKNSNLHHVSLSSYKKDDVTLFLDSFGIKSVYITSTNDLFFICGDSIYKKISSYLSLLDRDISQQQVKITIFETNLNDIKDRGSEISSYFKSSLDSSFNYFFNLITMPYNATTNITQGSKAGYYGVLKFLDSKGFSSVISSPFLLLRSGKDVYFSSVENIPYLVENKEIIDSKKSSSSSFDYRDVGLKVSVFPVFLDDGSIDLTLDLTIENIISNFENKPIISRKEIKGSYLLKKGELLILSGINQKLDFNNEFKVPLLGDIWILGNLFKYSKKDVKDSVLTVSIEIL